MNNDTCNATSRLAYLAHEDIQDGELHPGRNDGMNAPLLEGLGSGKESSEWESRETMVHPDASSTNGKRGGKKQKSILDSCIVNSMQPGSIKGSMFTLTTSIVGVGVLSIPFAVREAGLLLGIGMLVFGGIMSLFSLWLLVLCSRLCGAMSYGELALKSSGRRMTTVTQSAICVNLLGTAVGYLTGSSEMIRLVVKTLMGHSEGLLSSRSFLLSASTILVVFPPSLFRTVSELRYTSLFALICILYLTVMCTVKFSQTLYDGKLPWKSIHDVPLAHFESRNILTTVPLVIFAYTCHPNIFPLYCELQRPSEHRMYKVLARSMSVAVIVYTTIGVFVFLTFGDGTESNFLLNNHGDVGILLGGLTFGIALVATVPLFVHTLRLNLNTMFNESREMSVVAHVMVTLLLVASVLFLAVTTKDIASVLAILGATSNPVICFTLPAVFVCTLAKGPEYRLHRVAAILIAIVMTVTGFACLVNQIKNGY